MIPAIPQEYLHDYDRKALRDLKEIPVFDKICSKFIEIFNEKTAAMEDMASKIRLSEEQIPRVYNMLPSICEKLGIKEIPPVYLELNRMPKAYTYGDKNPAITITSGLLECLNDEEIYAVLAHECGHIACHHVLYHTMGALILNGNMELLLSVNLVGVAVSIPLKLAFYHWMRCSEFSADRAAVICCGKSEPVVQTMMRLAGGTSHIGDEINMDLFVEQAKDYDELRNSSRLNKFREFSIISTQNHPLLSARAYEATKWIDSEQYKNILSHLSDDEPVGDSDATSPEEKICHNCGTHLCENAVFCHACGTKYKQSNIVSTDTFEKDVL